MTPKLNEDMERGCPRANRLFRNMRWIKPSSLRLSAVSLRGHLPKQPLSLLPPSQDGVRLHLVAGQVILEGYENIDVSDKRRQAEFSETDANAPYCLTKAISRPNLETA
jgi:hypothetical protein